MTSPDTLYRVPTPAAPPATRAPRCILVDDHALLREGIRAGLEDRGVAVVAEAATGAEALACVERVGFDVLVVDLRLPDMDGLELCQLVREARGEVRCVIVSAHTEPELVRRALAEGCQGYVSKTAPAAAVGDAVLAVDGGGSFVDPSLTSALIDRGPQLSPREHEVLQMLADGMQTQGIAFTLGLSPETVKVYVAHLMRKLGVHSRTAAVAIAFRRSLVF